MQVSEDQENEKDPIVSHLVCSARKAPARSPLRGVHLNGVADSPPLYHSHSDGRVPFEFIYEKLRDKCPASCPFMQCMIDPSTGVGDG